MHPDELLLNNDIHNFDTRDKKNEFQSHMYIVEIRNIPLYNAAKLYDFLTKCVKIVLKCSKTYLNKVPIIILYIVRIRKVESDVERLINQLKISVACILISV